MKEIQFEDEKEIAKHFQKYLEKLKDEPEKYMPMCILCGEHKSWILMLHVPEGETRTALFGVCDHCHSREKGSDLPDEMVQEVMKKMKERMESGDHLLKLTKKNWMQ